MFRPTRRAVLLCAAGSVLAVGPSLAGTALWLVWALGLGASLLVLGLDAIATVRRREVEFAVLVPAALYLGGDSALVVQVSGPQRLRRVEVALAGSGVLASPPAVGVELHQGRGRVQLELGPLRRGRGAVTAAWLRWHSPLGLLWREHGRAVSAEFAVLPDVAAVKRQALRLRALRELRSGLKVEQFVGDGSEFEALREFVPGFDRRAIDWKASARHRQLLARQFRAERDHQVVLAIDTGNLMGEPLLGLPRVDHAINAALQLAWVCLKTGDLVGVYGFDDRPRAHCRPASGLQAMAGIQATLAGLDYSTAETNYTLALSDLLAQTRRRSLVVLFTEFRDSVTAELMVPNVLRVARRHLVLFVALRDPELPALAAAEPAVPLDLHRSVLASEMLREREVVLQRIRRAGALVVDAAAADVGTALINRYLDLKRREAV